MKILVFEYITGGGLARESLPESLTCEGDLMLRALLRDLEAIDGIHCMVMRDARLGRLQSDKATSPSEVLPIRARDEFEVIWKSAIRSTDAVWPIAPETAGILEKLCMDIRECGKRNLGSPSEAVALTSAKLKTLNHLAKSGIEVVPCVPLPEFRGNFPAPWVVKPDDGVGCEGAKFLRGERDLRCLLERSGGKGATMIIQPFLDGIPMSLSALFKHGEARLLSCNRQNILLRDDSFLLTGCTVNIQTTAPEIFSKMTASIARSIPALFGYAGVDLILGKDGPKVLEINPRLTTSYAGLSNALKRNIAAMVLYLSRDSAKLPEIFQNRGSSVDVCFGDAHVA